MTTPSNGRSVVGFIGLGDQGLPMAEAKPGSGSRSTPGRGARRCGTTHA